MAWLLLLILIALPVVEIGLFIQSSHWIGVLPTIAVAILAGMAGMALLRAQGIATLWRLRGEIDRGRPPVAEAFDGLCLGVAGLLLLLPGFFTDVLALPLLLPPVRALLRRWLASHVRGVVVAGGNPAQPRRPQVIDAEYTVVHPEDRRGE